MTKDGYILETLAAGCQAGDSKLLTGSLLKEDAYKLQKEITDPSV